VATPAEPDAVAAPETSFRGGFGSIQPRPDLVPGYTLSRFKGERHPAEEPAVQTRPSLQSNWGKSTAWNDRISGRPTRLGGVFAGKLLEQVAPKIPPRLKRPTARQRAVAAATLPTGSVAEPDAADILLRVSVLLYQHIVRGELSVGRGQAALPLDATPRAAPKQHHPRRHHPRRHHGDGIATAPNAWFVPQSPLVHASGPRLHELLSPALRETRSALFSPTTPTAGTAQLASWLVPSTPRVVSHRGERHEPSLWSRVTAWFGGGKQDGDSDEEDTGYTEALLQRPVISRRSLRARDTKPSLTVTSWSGSEATSEVESESGDWSSDEEEESRSALHASAIQALTTVSGGQMLTPASIAGSLASEELQTAVERLASEAQRMAIWGEDDPYAGLSQADLRFHEREFECAQYSILHPTAAVQLSLLGGAPHAVRRHPRPQGVPSIRAIERLASLLYNDAQLTPECSVICLIYIERLMNAGGVNLLASNWRPLLVGGLLLASKVWQDLSTWNAEFADILNEWPVVGINELERRFVAALGFDLYIAPSTYSQYYFALRSMGESASFRKRFMGMVLASKPAGAPKGDSESKQAPSVPRPPPLVAAATGAASGAGGVASVTMSRRFAAPVNPTPDDDSSDDDGSRSIKGKAYCKSV
jgi:hypothetical protein